MVQALLQSVVATLYWRAPGLVSNRHPVLRAASDSSLASAGQCVSEKLATALSASARDTCNRRHLVRPEIHRWLRQCVNNMLLSPELPASRGVISSSQVV